MILNERLAGSAIHIGDCAKTFADGTRALKPIALDVASGETLVLLGPSGCGKTTLLRIISGLERPDAGGRILFDGDDVTALPIEKRDIGMVFQSYALFPNMNVGENVAYGLKVRGASRADRDREALHFLGLCRIQDLAHRRIDQLSGGQRQRVALARALAVKPRALLLDEPLTALDAALRETLRTEIADLLRSLRVTSIYVTHDQNEAMVLADRLVVMRDGVIRQLDTPERIYAHPSDRFVAEFVGKTNIINGSTRAGRFVTAFGGMTLREKDRTRERDAIFFRPEHLRIGPPEGADFRLHVAGMHFHGATKRVSLLADDTRIETDVAGATPIAIGDEVGVSVDPAHLMDLADR